MKTKLLLGATLLLGIQLQAQELSKPKEIKLNGAFTNPVVAPNGKFVLLTKEHNHGVYLLDMTTKKVTTVTTKAGTGYGYVWNSDSKTCYFKEKGENEYLSNSKVMAYSISEKKTIALAINPNFLPSYNGKNEIVVHTNPATLKIEATHSKTSKNWIVTNNEGSFYNAILSNDGKKVAVHNGADIWVYDSNGTDKGKRIGKGIATAWSANDNYLIGFLDESKDGHVVSNSELLLFDVENSRTAKLTATENKIEMFPSLYGNNQVIFSEEKTGKIYVATLKL